MVRDLVEFLMSAPAPRDESKFTAMASNQQSFYST